MTRKRLLRAGSQLVHLGCGPQRRWRGMQLIDSVREEKAIDLRVFDEPMQSAWETQLIEGSRARRTGSRARQGRTRATRVANPTASVAPIAPELEGVGRLSLTPGL